MSWQFFFHVNVIQCFSVVGLADRFPWLPWACLGRYCPICLLFCLTMYYFAMFCLLVLCSQVTFQHPLFCKYFQYTHLVVIFLEVPSQSFIQFRHLFHIFCLCHAWNYGNARALYPGTNPGANLLSSAPWHLQQ